METKERMISSPRYQKVAIGIAQRIVDGKFPLGQKIKSRSTLASYFNVSPETARKAINVLADLDIVSVRQGSGVIVVSRDKAIEYLEKFEATAGLKEMKQDIQRSLLKQKQELDAMNKMMDTFLSQASLIRKKFPFEPLNLWHQTGATVVALTRKGELLLSPGPYATVRKGDILYFVGDDFAFSRMKNLFDIL